MHSEHPARRSKQNDTKETKGNEQNSGREWVDVYKEKRTLTKAFLIVGMNIIIMSLCLLLLLVCFVLFRGCTAKFFFYFII